MKLSLDTIGYGGYFTAPGERLSLEEAVKRTAKFGYDAACIYAHRPLGFPLDLDQDRRKKLKDLVKSLELELGAIICCTNFLEANHVLLYHQEKEILYVNECIDLAKDLDMKIVRVLAAFFGYFRNPYGNQGYGGVIFQEHSPSRFQKHSPLYSKIPRLFYYIKITLNSTLYYPPWFF